MLKLIHNGNGNGNQVQSFCIIFVIGFILLINFSHSFIIKDNESFLQNPHYDSQEEIEDLFARLEKSYPENVKIHFLGRSLEGRNLIAIQISKNVRFRNLLNPIVKFIGNMHGDETIGRQLLIYLAQYLLRNKDTNLEISNLINATDIYLMPTMNPDGFARSKEGRCESLFNYVGRTNAAGVDLNRDFPDRLDNQSLIQMKSETRQPETAALINWILSTPFVLSANFHGGAVVASYPYDNSIARHECCEESPTPDDRVFKSMAHTYADSHPIMRTGFNCNDTFREGITNGANWYELNGGMQDFNYAFSNCFELTIELSCCKYPLAATLPDEWNKNKRSLINLLKFSHNGVKGLVLDTSGYPIRDARITVQGIEDKVIRTTRRGEYWRLLTPGIYNIQASAYGYQASPFQQIEVGNSSGKLEPLRLNFTLTPVKAKYDDAYRITKVEEVVSANGFLTPTEFVHHNYTEMEKFIRNLAESYPSITRLYSIGKSVENRDLWVMEITAKPGRHLPGVPEFKYVANMHGNEVVGRELLLYLTKYICEQYLVDDRITRLVNNTRMHFLYSMNPDGYEISKEGDKTSSVGRENANNVDLNRNFPDQYGSNAYNTIAEPEVRAVMNWTLSIPFVLSANLHGGSLVANYPYDDNPNDFDDPFARMRTQLKNGRKSNPTEDNEMFKHLALVYSTVHPKMHLGNPCPLFRSEVFPNGITNGAKWYSVTGGMQDWNYDKAGVFELTLELSCDKYPMAKELQTYWKDNRPALIEYIEQVLLGIHGFVRSSIGTPIVGATISLDGAKHVTYSASGGDYWKLALPGRHNITVKADGYETHYDEVEIPQDGKRSIRLDITMMRDDPQHWASAHDYRIIENVVRTHYHSNEEIKRQLAEIENKNVRIASFGYADNEFSMNFNSIKLTDDIGAPEEMKYRILIISSIFDTTSPLGREIMMNTIRHIVEGYKIQEPPIVSLLKKSVLYFIPIMDNFDDILQMFEKNNSICDPVVANEFANRILNSQSEKRRDLFMKYLENEKFDMILTFSAGSNDITYPHQPMFEKLAHSIEKVESDFSHQHCDGTSTRTAHHELTERTTNLFYNLHSIPMFSLGLSCCRMPEQKEIASVWRKNLEKILNFLHLVETGVQGSVVTADGQPLRQSEVKIIDISPVYSVTKNSAHFHLIVPSGKYALEIACSGYESKLIPITVNEGKITDVGRIVLTQFNYISGTAVGVTKQIRYSSISGYVLDTFNHPISNGKVSIIWPKISKYDLKNFTDSLGAYTINNVPPGDVTLQVEAPSHVTTTRLVHVGNRSENVHGVVFHLKISERVMGMPRLLFIMITGTVLIILLVSCIFLVQFLIARHYRTDKRYYNFSLLTEKGKELFEDDEHGETELFRSPIKKGMVIQPYFDEDLEPIVNSDDEDDDDDSETDIIMINKSAQYCD